MSTKNTTNTKTIPKSIVFIVSFVFIVHGPEAP